MQQQGMLPDDTEHHNTPRASAAAMPVATCSHIRFGDINLPPPPPPSAPHPASHPKPAPRKTPNNNTPCDNPVSAAGTVPASPIDQSNGDAMNEMYDKAMSEYVSQDIASIALTSEQVSELIVLQQEPSNEPNVLSREQSSESINLRPWYATTRGKINKSKSGANKKGNDSVPMKPGSRPGFVSLRDWANAQKRKLSPEKEADTTQLSKQSRSQSPIK